MGNLIKFSKFVTQISENLFYLKSEQRLTNDSVGEEREINC